MGRQGDPEREKRRRAPGERELLRTRNLCDLFFSGDGRALGSP